MSIEDTLREELKVANEKVRALEVQNEEQLRSMNDLYSDLSVVLHRHLPLSLDALKKDIEKTLSISDVILRPWWQKQQKKALR